jgi:hypothetical protein
VSPVHAGALAALFASSLAVISPARADGQSSGGDVRGRWLSANQLAIARIHSPQERAHARKEFATTLARMNAPAVTPATADLRAAAAAELVHPGRYQLADRFLKPRPKTLWERFWQWASDTWNRMWNALFGRVHLGRSGSLALGDALIAVAGAALLFAIFRLLVNLQIEREARNRTSYQALDAQRSAYALYARASSLAAQGAFAEAIRTLFAAAVVALDLRGIVHDHVSATVGDMRRELRARDASLASPFDRVAREFVAAAYAEQPMEAQDWESAREGYAALVARQQTA